MIIDSHQHAFWHDRDDAGLIADMDAQGIDLAWLLTWEIPPDQDVKAYHKGLNPLALRRDGTHAGITLSDILRARDNYPKRFVAGYCPDPALPTAAECFEAAWNMHGVRVCGEWKFRMLLDDPRSLELFRTAGRLGAPVIVHLDVPYLKRNDKNAYQKEWYGGTVANLERALQACPETNFLGHGPGFWREISGDADEAPRMYPQGPIVGEGRLIRLFETYPNLYGDMSASSCRYALSRDPENAKAFLTRFADRALFARDTCGGDLHEFLQSLDLSEDVREKIYCRNAQRLVASEE